MTIPSNKTLIITLRQMSKETGNPAGTHSDECWNWHPMCCALLIARRLEEVAITNADS